MSEKQDVLDAFNAIKNALIECDTDAIEDLFDSDYRGYNIRGEEENRALVIDVFKPGKIQIEQFDTQDITVNIIGDVGIITGTGSIAGRYGGLTFGHNLRFMDIFVRRGSSWKYYMSQSTELEKL